MTGRLVWEVDGADWPNRAASRFVVAGGLRWHVQCAGAAQAPVVLLLHGTGAANHSWRDLLTPLAERVRVVAPDLPGHGFTSVPQQGSTFSLPGMAKALAALLTELDASPALIVGHSAGAAVAVQMCLDGLARPRAVVGFNAALLPLPGVAGSMFSPIARTLALNPWVPRAFAWSAGVVPGLAERLLEGTGSSLDARGRALYARLVRSPGHVAAALAMMAGWELDTLRRRLPTVGPTLHLVAGERDRTLPPAQSRQVAAVVPKATVTVLEGLGHLAHEEQPLRVLDLLWPWIREACAD